MLAGHTEDMVEYLHKSVPVTMLADLKDSVRNNRDINIMDKYGATAVSGEGGERQGRGGGRGEGGGGRGEGRGK